MALRPSIARSVGVALAPRNAQFLETRAEIFERLGDRDAALADYKSAIAVGPESDENVKLSREGLKRLGAAATPANAGIPPQ